MTKRVSRSVAISQTKTVSKPIRARNDARVRSILPQRFSEPTTVRSSGVRKPRSTSSGG